MEVKFADANLGTLETDQTKTFGRPPEVVKAFRKRMQFIRAAKDERDFYSMKSFHFEKLQGNRQHQHSIRLNDQWRLTLELQEQSSGGNIVIIVGIEDYH